MLKRRSTHPPRVSDRQYLERVLEERHGLYLSKLESDRLAVSVGLAAQKELVQAAFLASEKAIVKAEAAQASYNATHNDLSRKMDTQYATMMPRTETTALVEGLKEKVAALEKSHSEKLSALEKSQERGTGKAAGLSAGWGYLVGALGIALALYSATR